MAWNSYLNGRKDYESIATITTELPISQAINKVHITIDALTKSKINSLKLYVSLDAGFSNADSYSVTPETGEVTFQIDNSKENCYYKIEANCAAGTSNGLIQVSKVIFAN